MQRVLIVNDDGYRAAGIRALIREFAPYYDVVAVAPDREQSWMAKSISGHHDLHLTPVSYHEFEGFHVNGTPADCTQLGLYEVGAKPKFVVSGINQGANIGHGHIMSSGTIGAALEAAFQGVPSFAVSVWQVKRHNRGIDFTAPEAVEIFKNVARITRQIIEKIMQAGFPQSSQVIAINMAYDVALDSPWAITRPHTISYGRLFSKQESGSYRNFGSTELVDDGDGASDLTALAKGYVSIVPLSLQLTSDAGRSDLAGLLGIEIMGNNSP